MTRADGDDEGMEQVRKWIDNLFTVLCRFASHRVFYHRFEVISKFEKTLFFSSSCIMYNDNTKIQNKPNDGRILCEFSSLLVFIEIIVTSRHTQTNNTQTHIQLGTVK